MTGKKLERPLFLDIPFGEALVRFAQTNPKEVEPAPGRKRKAAKPSASKSKPKSG